MGLLYFTALLSLCATVAQGGSVGVRFAEGDFRSAGGATTLSISVIVEGTQDNRAVQFRVEAITAQQFRDQSPTCVDDHGHQVMTNLPTNAAEGAASDLDTTGNTCSRPLGPTLSTVVSCPLPIAQDNVLETNEFFVLILTVVDDGGNDVTVTRNCSIGRISVPSNPGAGFSLSASAETRELSEGYSSASFIQIDKTFETDFPIKISITYQGNASQGSGGDYLLNGGVQTIIFPAGETSLGIPLQVFDDGSAERNEVFSVTITARVITNLLNTEIAVNPSSIDDILILDEQIVTIGLNVTQPTITVAEGDTLTLCAELKNFDIFDYDRNFFVSFIVEKTPAGSEDLETVTEPLNPDIWIAVRVCHTYRVPTNEIAESPRTFRVTIADQLLTTITDPTGREHRRRLNPVNPSFVTVNVEDDDGTPNRPDITEIGLIGDKELGFKWTINQEGGLRPVDCFYGNVTEIPGDGALARETVFTFNFCGSGNPKAREHVFEAFDNSKGYAIVVCARNHLGDNCTEPMRLIIPPTNKPVAGPDPGVIVGVVVAILLLLTCFFVLIILICVIFVCGCNTEKKYFPERREKKFGKIAQSQCAHYSVTDDEFYMGKLDYDSS